MTIDRPTTLPPSWAESLLRLILRPEDRDSVSGDLLEEYRESIVPALGAKANSWYIRQVAWYVLRATWAWGLALAVSVVFRNTLDWWLSPTQDFYARSVASTWSAIAIFMGSGALTGWRSRSLRAGALAGVLTGAIAAAIETAVSLGQLAIQHDAHTMRMIAASGGLEEVFVLPFIVIVPGTFCACVGAAIGKTLAVFYSRAKTNSA